MQHLWLYSIFYIQSNLNNFLTLFAGLNMNSQVSIYDASDELSGTNRSKRKADEEAVKEAEPTPKRVSRSAKAAPEPEIKEPEAVPEVAPTPKRTLRSAMAAKEPETAAPATKRTSR